MRPLRLIAPSLFLIASVALAQQVFYFQAPRTTDAERDDLAGPVASVSTIQTYSGLRWSQPGGPTLVEPVWYNDCEYDEQGNHTKSGQVRNGIFLGEITRILYDASVHATDLFHVDASTGELVRRDVVEPRGITEQTFFTGGKPYLRQTFSYDQYGHTIDFITFDGAGKQTARVHTERDADGNVKEKWVMGKDQQIETLHTYDPKSEEEHYLSFNPFGGLTLSWSLVAGNLTKFWESPDSPTQYGDNFTEHPSPGTEENYACHSDGTCDFSRVHYEYLDPDQRNQISVEWSDADGNLRYAAYYEFKIDLFRNWTYRQIWVWSPELVERKLLETDSRTITYWHQ